MVGSEQPDLAAALATAAPRVLTAFAPAGYGKGALLRRYAQHAGTLVVCDLGEATEGHELARSVVDALNETDHSRAALSVAGRLAERRDLAASATREALRSEWSRESGPELFALRDAAGALATPAGVELVAELVSGLPASRTLAITTRTPLPPALAQIVERERWQGVEPADLALRRDDVRALAQRAGVATDAADIAYEIAHGWPLVSRLIIDLARHAPSIVSEAAELPAETLLPFLMHRTLAGLDETVRQSLVVTALLRAATQTDLMRVLGNVCDDLVFLRLTALPFVQLEGNAVSVHPETAALLRTRFGSLVKSCYERTLSALTGDGSYVGAARVAIEGGDVNRAAAILDAAPPYTAARVPLAEYERLLDGMDRALVTRYPNVWLATIPYRAFAVERAQYVREAETVYYCLPRTASSEQRAVVLMHLASAYVNVGRSVESDQLLDDALSGFASKPVPARATLLTFRATLRGILGKSTSARALAEEAASIAQPDFMFGENQTLHYIEAHEAAYRGQAERALVMFDELVRRHASEQLPLYLAYTATNGAFVAWVNGDDARFQRYLGVLEDRLTAGIQRGFAPMIDAARGRNARVDVAYTWPVLAAIAHLYRIAEASVHAEALDAARAAVRAADERGDPYVQIFAHTAVYVLDESARESEGKVLLEIAGGVESPELLDAVRKLIAGETPGLLEPFVRLRLLRDREQRESRLVVELLAGRVTRDGEPVKLTEKEFEFLALLASSHGVISRDRIGEALWDHLDPEEWPNNVKVTLSRLRSKLGVRDAVAASGGGYRLAGTVDVDLRRAEAMLRETQGEAVDEPVREALRAIVSAFGEGAAVRYERFGWMQSTLVRMQGVVCTAGLKLARAALSAARFDEALSEARIVADIDPFNEEACEVIVRALTARGELDAARREYRRYATALAEELGAKPSEQLAALLRG